MTAMTEGLRLVLLVFAVVGYGGAGASLAVCRYRDLAEGERDWGMFGVAGMLGVFGSLCTVVAAGILGLAAFGAVMLWAGYVLMAQHMGTFRIEAGRRYWTEERAEEEPRRAK
ncbi:MAG: hypothetical protein HY561_14035 [Gemmatimonadetes bacterium]|nr:hypothetical protein [Gemmatimonadota bacterium]